MSKDQVTSFRIDSELWKKARVYALENGLSAKDLVETLIRQELQERNIEKRKKRWQIGFCKQNTIYIVEGNGGTLRNKKSMRPFLRLFALFASVYWIFQTLISRNSIVLAYSKTALPTVVFTFYSILFGAMVVTLTLAISLSAVSRDKKVDSLVRGPFPNRVLGFLIFLAILLLLNVGLYLPIQHNAYYLYALIEIGALGPIFACLLLILGAVSDFI